MIVTNNVVVYIYMIMYKLPRLRTWTLLGLKRGFKNRREQTPTHSNLATSPVFQIFRCTTEVLGRQDWLVGGQPSWPCWLHGP